MSTCGRLMNVQKSVFASSSSRPRALQAPTRPTATQTIPRDSNRPRNHQNQPSPSSSVAPDAALGTARGYGQSTPRELQLPCTATLSSAKLRATRTGPPARALATPAIPLARTSSGCGCAAPPSSLVNGRVGE